MFTKGELRGIAIIPRGVPHTQSIHPSGFGGISAALYMQLWVHSQIEPPAYRRHATTGKTTVRCGRCHRTALGVLATDPTPNMCPYGPLLTFAGGVLGVSLCHGSRTGVPGLPTCAGTHAAAGLPPAVHTAPGYLRHTPHDFRVFPDPCLHSRRGGALPARGRTCGAAARAPPDPRCPVSRLAYHRGRPTVPEAAPPACMQAIRLFPHCPFPRCAACPDPAVAGAPASSMGSGPPEQARAAT